MKHSLEKMYSMWVDYMKNGHLSSEVEPYISESWVRCKNYGVDYLNGGQAQLTTAEELSQIVTDNRDLITVATPVVNRIHTTLSNVDLIWFTDKDGFILKIAGSKFHLDRVKKFNIYPGARWCEEIIGTNAISLCLSLNRMVQTIGPQHYCQSHHSVICTAAPIHQENGEILGILNLSANISTLSDAQCRSLQVVADLGAYSIGRQIDLFRAKELNNKTFESISEGIIITDRELCILKINQNTSQILEIHEDAILGKKLSELLRDVDFNALLKQGKSVLSELAFYMGNHRVNCRGTITPLDPLNFRQKTNGFTVVFSEEKRYNRSVNRISGNRATYTFNDILTQNKHMLELLKSAQKIAKSNCSVLITGESGTGKELLAQAIHNASKKAQGPFVAVNCAAIPRNLVESELFGYEKGAFTGALSDGMPGKFELADGGTLFLDELGDLPLEIQPKLLRVLDGRRVTRIGGKHEKLVDVRLICATNKDLINEVTKTNFRLDLYYRINVVNFQMPSLCEKREDIRLIANHFLEKLNKEEPKNTKVFSDEFINALESYNWSGNIRQLQNIIARSFYLCDEQEDIITLLPEEMMHAPTPTENHAVESFDVMEKNMIMKSIEQNRGNITQAARSLNISKSTIYRKIEKYGISVSKNNV